MSKIDRPLLELNDDVDSWNQEDASELLRPPDLKKHRITVASRDWTVETIVRQISQGNVDLDPAFQRRNAWRDPRRSRLIESFILGFPVPQIVLAEHPRRRGTFIVIDGKQRLLTLAGLYIEKYRHYWTQPRFAGLKVIGDLNRVQLNTFLTSAQYSDERRQLENADIRTTVITGYQQEAVLYDIFYRINTGSVPLSSQELRQVLNRGDFARYLLEVTSTPNSLWEVLDVDEPDPRLRDVELLLRLIAWRTSAGEYKGNLAPFLDDTMERLNSRWSTARMSVEPLVKELFEAAKAAIHIFGPAVGRKAKKSGYERHLNRALFEVQAYYLSFADARKAALRKKKAIVDSSRELFDDIDFLGSIEATTKSVENYRIRFDKYRRMLERTLGIRVEPLGLPPR
jgi:hypothetical protein